MNAFGDYLRAARESRLKGDRHFSVRGVAKRVGIEPSYLSKIERGLQPPPGEDTVRRLAVDLGEDPDALLALGGKVSGDLLTVIRRRPKLFAQLIRQMKALPDHAILRLVREVRDGKW
ncbi:MAG TPA: helix-turn-helix transcriptional regulator [Verrucomicrobiae bacterium]|nr:helix-turn-helix transcriptional regulator [Verrucomicrobiae bacterium]